MMVHNDIAAFIGLKPVTYRFLKSISLSRNISHEGCTNYDLELVLGKLLDGDGIEYLKVFSTGVTEINIGEIGGMFGLLVNIEDIRDRQLEGISFRISEQENNAFSFNCANFYASLID